MRTTPCGHSCGQDAGNSDLQSQEIVTKKSTQTAASNRRGQLTNARLLVDVAACTQKSLDNLKGRGGKSESTAAVLLQAL